MGERAAGDDWRCVPRVRPLLPRLCPPAAGQHVSLELCDGPRDVSVSDAHADTRPQELIAMRPRGEPHVCLRVFLEQYLKRKKKKKKKKKTLGLYPRLKKKKKKKKK